MSDFMPSHSSLLRTRSLPALLMAATCLASLPAKAQALDEENSFALDPIIVSAQKREEVDKDVPVSVEAFDAESLEAMDISNTQDVIAKTPNIAIRTGANGLDNQISIRGIGPIIPFSDSSVPVFVDGVPVPASQSLMMLKNVDRVEVLRGPQGTFFGQNAVAGAINIHTKLPSRERRVEVSAGVGSRGHYQTDAHISGEMSEDRVYGGLTFHGKKGNGFVKNLATGENADKYDTVALRGNLIFTPSDDLEVRLTGDVSDEKRPARYYSIRPTHSVNSTATLKDQNTSAGGSATIIYDTENFEIRSLSNVRQTRINSGFAAPMRMDALARIASQELRFTSNDSDNPLQWMGAIYLADKLDKVHQQYPTFSAIWDTNLKTRRGAVFGELSYDFNDRWNVAVGGRLSYIKREADQVYVNTALASLSNSFEFNKNYVGFAPKISTVYKLTPDMNVYGTISTGFKPGTLNYGATSPANAELKSETSTNFEIGVKGNALADRLSYAFSTFYIRSKDYQAYDTKFQNFNLDRTSSKGFEAQVSALLTENWRLDASVGYTRTKIEKNDEPKYQGNEFSTAPRWTARVGSSYRHEFNEDLSGTLSADVTYQSSMWGTLLNQPDIKVDGYALVNATAGLDYKNLSFKLHGKNLLNKKYATEVSSAAQWTPGESRSVLATVSARF